MYLNVLLIYINVLVTRAREKNKKSTKIITISKKIIKKMMTFLPSSRNLLVLILMTINIDKMIEKERALN